MINPTKEPLFCDNTTGKLYRWVTYPNGKRTPFRKFAINPDVLPFTWSQREGLKKHYNITVI